MNSLLASGLLFVLSSATTDALPWRSIRWALGQIETGQNDRAIGRHREVSRYQIMPYEWRRFSRTRDWHDPSAAWTVALSILLERIATVEGATRKPIALQSIYLVWNAPAAFRRAHHNPRHVNRTLRDRAVRFENLVLHASTQH